MKGEAFAAKILATQSRLECEPNAPRPALVTQAGDVRLEFFLNYQMNYGFHQGEKGVLRFRAWGEFYEVLGDDPDALVPNDWQIPQPSGTDIRHFLFYFRDETFEAVASGWEFCRQWRERFVEAPEREIAVTLSKLGHNVCFHYSQFACGPR